jgi:CheY-like chemotaxis protein
LPTVLGDATQLHQVLLNLVVNARDAMPQGGTLTLEADPVEVDAALARGMRAARPGRYSLLRVSDTGTGIPPEILGRIFEPFFSTKGQDKGTGLGLSTVSGIVKGHGGFLHVDSTPGHGSVFSVYLPAESAGNQAAPVASVEVAFRGQGDLILVVDDEAAVRQMFRSVLQSLNFKVMTAADGAEALIVAAAHEGELRAVITDLHMPNLDGLALARAMRRLLPEVPIIVASGQLDEKQAAGFQSLGLTARIDKPFSQPALAAVLRANLKRSPRDN